MNESRGFASFHGGLFPANAINSASINKGTDNSEIVLTFEQKKEKNTSFSFRPVYCLIMNQLRSSIVR